MTTRTKNTTDTIEQPELIQAPAEPNQEQAEQSEEAAAPLTAKEQYYNVLDEEKRVKDLLAENQGKIQDHMARIAELQENHREARQAHSTAKSNEHAHVEQVERQRVLARIAGPAEQATLQVLQTEQDTLAMLTEEARQALDRAEYGLDEIGGITDAIEQIKTECVQLEREQDVMKSLASDFLYKWGKDEQAKLIDELIAAQADFAEKEAALRVSRSNLQEVQGSVKERLRYWPGFKEQVEKEYLQIIPAEEIARTVPAEHIVKAYLAYVKVLAEHGAALQRLGHKDMAKLLGVLDLNPSMLRGFFSYDHIFKQGRAEIAENYLHEKPWLDY